MAKCNLTHGEKYVYCRSNLDFKDDIGKMIRNLERLPKRMERKKAINYYNAKLRKVFGIEEVEIKDFRRIEEYYDFFDTKRLLATIKRF
ncbi:MAG TPA: hypothetical protein VIR31_00085 [Nitrososphaeraceae archaeon]